ncbi:hypothetical protein KUCAC02_019745 [Chaenocephalus aceratus]|uniref:Uncharacterized protein n=1 Tax=Chaenocephalus aceratus TaxID=36190 RepID=A0ACB9VQS6_CHAAC|nr:hypothetical protein KUCAC02_019745 [Chaenocephalus aceratus]
MIDLLEKIKGEHKDVAEVLQNAGIHNYSDTLSLTQLLELFPGHKYLKLRRTIVERIQEPGQLLRKMKSLIPREDFKAALTGNGVLVDYLCIMKEMQTHVKHILSFHEAHIRFLEENLPNQPDPESAPNLKEPPGHSSVLLKEIENRDSDAADVLRQADLSIDSDIRSLTREDLLELFPGPKKFKLRRRIFEMIQKPVKQLPPTGVNNGNPSRGRPQTSSPSSLTVIPVLHECTKAVTKRKGKLVYRVVVTGTTFDAHFQLMEKVKKEVQDQFDLVQSYSNDYDVIIVFCPIVSRMGPDVESAMRDVKGDKPVILVLMHHTYAAKFIPNVQQGANVQLQVNVFFHETKRGLLYCGENEAVVCEITKYLLQGIPIPIAQKSLVQLLKQMKDISADFKAQPDSFSPDALTDNGVLVDNLYILKDMKTHMKDMQSFLDDHICSLEANIQNQPNQESVTNVTKSCYDNCPEGAHGDKPVILVLMHHAYEAKFIPKPGRKCNIVYK